DQLGGGKDAGVHHVPDRALRFHLELPEGFELVAKELGAQRMTPVWREAVEDAATEAELATSLDQRLPPVAERRQPAQQIVHRVGLRWLQSEAPASQRLGRKRRPGHRGPRGEADDRLTRAEGVDRLQPTPDRFLIGSNAIE